MPAACVLWLKKMPDRAIPIIKVTAKQSVAHTPITNLFIEVKTHFPFVANALHDLNQSVQIIVYDANIEMQTAEKHNLNRFLTTSHCSIEVLICDNLPQG